MMCLRTQVCGVAEMKENDLSERIRSIEEQLNTQQQQLTQQSDNIQQILRILQEKDRAIPTDIHTNFRPIVSPLITPSPPVPSLPTTTVIADPSNQKKPTAIRHKRKRAIQKTKELYKRFPILIKWRTDDNDEHRSVCCLPCPILSTPSLPPFLSSIKSSRSTRQRTRSVIVHRFQPQKPTASSAQ
jgi:hypothetical protein